MPQLDTHRACVKEIRSTGNVLIDTGTESNLVCPVFLQHLGIGFDPPGPNDIEIEITGKCYKIVGRVQLRWDMNFKAVQRNMINISGKLNEDTFLVLDSELPGNDAFIGSVTICERNLVGRRRLLSFAARVQLRRPVAVNSNDNTSLVSAFLSLLMAHRCCRSAE
jgi:hypothetical protein